MLIAETFDKKKFDDYLISQNASVLQSWAWGEFQKKLNRKVWRFLLTTDTGKLLAAASVVRMPLPKGKCYLYCPRGPVVGKEMYLQKIWQLFLDKLEDIALVEKPVFFRADPSVASYPDFFLLENLGFRKIGWEVQPKDTLILDLTKSEKELLHQMKPKTRYNINLAQRRGVVVKSSVNSQDIKLFWQLMQETVARDKFSAHPYVYYHTLLETLSRHKQAELHLAFYQNRPLAAVLVAYFGATCWYLHGASSNKLRSLMAPHLLQWTAIKKAKKKNMQFYDFNGVAPSSAGKKHPWAGITRFKKGFGGREVSYVGAYDLPYSKLWYGIYRAARKLNRFR